MGGDGELANVPHHHAMDAHEPYLLSGFAAGTPVLTPRGSVPIERLAAGDLVLAPGPDGSAPVARKVLRREMYVDMEVQQLMYHPPGETARVAVLNLSPHHPFREANRARWLALGRIDWLEAPKALATAAGPVAIAALRPFHPAGEDGLAWVGYNDLDGDGHVWNLEQGIEVRQFVPFDPDWDGELRFFGTLFDLEVEEAHAYLAGPHGLLVADASLEGGHRESHAREYAASKALLEAAYRPLLPDPVPRKAPAAPPPSRPWWKVW